VLRVPFLDSGTSRAVRLAVMGQTMKTTLAVFVLFALVACQAPPRALVSPQEQEARDNDHAQIRQERAQQEYWEWERGGRDGRP
jgi:hypothetical protein